MNNYLVLKATGKGTKSGRSAVVLPLSGTKGKAFRVVGNIPELYHGMMIEMEVDADNIALDYILAMSEKNVAALEKAGVNPEEYQAILERHMLLKGDGIGWNEARLGLDEIYKVLPFREADKVHKEMVNNAIEPTRVEAIGKKIIESARNRRKIAYKIEEYLGYFDDVEQEGAYQQLMVSLKMLCLQASQYGVKNGTVWDNEMKNKEDYIKDNIEKRKASEYGILTKEEIKRFLKTVENKGLAEEQLQTLWSLQNSRPCVITGGAGVGKTTVIKTLLECYTKCYAKKNVLLIAPTGKAARRLAQKTEMPASTIHKALRKNPEDDYTYYSEKNPMPYRLIIVDESSMIDTALMYDLLSAVDPTSKIIFVGDHNQLYPVGYGEPFYDFLSCLDVYRLNKNHRQSEDTDILLNANRFLNGEEVHTGRGFYVAEIDYQNIGDILESNNDETQIISPFNALNAEINDYLCKREKSSSERFAVGDKVMTIANTKTYSNGDIGVITEITKKKITVDIEGKVISLTEAHWKDLTLAYAITVHKMQGSEANRIILFVPKENALVTNRLLYTAATRAKEQLEVYYYAE